jgi:hypothetical protein
MLLAYTDGLIERRHRAITDGIDVLTAQVSGLDPCRPVAVQLEELVRQARRPADGDSPLDDDVAAVLIRVLPSTG